MPNPAFERLRAYIDRVGRENELSDRELARVRAMFIAKGISLDADCAPYRDMISDTVKNLRAIRDNSRRAEHSAHELRESQSELQARLQEALRRLQAASSRLQQQAAAIRNLKGVHEPDAKKTDKLTAQNKLVLSVAGIPVVAGPKELQ